MSKKQKEQPQGRIIKKVIRNKANDQLLVTIPKDSHIREGDYVDIIKVPGMEADKSQKEAS